MPAPLQDFIEMPPQAAIRVSLEPANSAIRSLILVGMHEHKSGLAPWVEEVARAMTEEERQVHDLVVIGLHYAVAPTESWPSLPVYIDHLSRMNPTALRDKMMSFYDRMPVLEEVPQEDVIDSVEALESPENYLTFLHQRFAPENVDEEIELRAFQYVANPPAMRQVIVDHLWRMWRKYLKPEWDRVRPMLQETVRAYQQIDFSKMTFDEAYQTVTGREIVQEKWHCLMEGETKRMVFVPHPHVGPYVLRGVGQDDTLYVFFGLRPPQGVAIEAPDLSRNEIVVRLSALADDTRLRILRYIAENGETRSQEIMEVLDLSQSAASRHLTQLTATGYLNERRCEGAKCYALNTERLHDTLQAVSNFLLVRERSEI